MGNQMTESHKQSSMNEIRAEDETNRIVHSIVTDLVNIVHVNETMTSAPDPREDESYYFEAEDLMQLSHKELDQSERSSPLSESSDVSPNNENGYSSGRSSGSTSLSDWKYTPNGYPNPNDYESIGSKYNDILDSWNRPKEDKMPVKPPRTSLIRKFDPLYSTPSEPSQRTHSSCSNHSAKDRTLTYNSSPIFEVSNDSRSLSRSPPKVYPETNRIRLNYNYQYITDPMDYPQVLNNSKGTVVSVNLDDSTGLISQFAECKIDDNNENDNRTMEKAVNTTLTDEKPDVLVFAADQQKDKEFEEKIDLLNNDLKEKDLKIEELMKDLKTSKENETKLMSLIEVFHSINEELVLTAEKALRGKDEEVKSHHIHDQNQKDETISFLTETKEKQDIEIRELKEKLFWMEKEMRNKAAQSHGSDNELIASKVQIKRLEMKINSLENQLVTKNKENGELSSMVDDLIAKVRV